MASSLVTVALAQYAPRPESSANIAAITSLAEDARDAGAGILVLPEYAQAFVPGGGPAWASVAEELDGPFVTEMTALSRRLDGLIIVAGMLVAKEGAGPRNTIVAVGPEGLMSRVEKLHLYDAFGATESESVSLGDIEPPQVVDIGGLRWGFLTCYDLRFPEVARRLVDAGATCLVVPAQWVPGPHKVHHWNTLLAARALENQCFVLAAGHPGPHGIGHSAAMDPLGVVLTQAGDGSELLVVGLDPASVHSVRDANPMARARRFSITA
jgi:predicted amidohydrolase